MKTACVTSFIVTLKVMKQMCFIQVTVTLFIKFCIRSSIIFIQSICKRVALYDLEFRKCATFWPTADAEPDRSSNQGSKQKLSRKAQKCPKFFDEDFPIPECMAETVINQAIVMSDMLRWSNSKMTT